MPRLALVNLDNGLFLEKLGRWTIEPKFAQSFQDVSEIETAALESNVKNAAAAVLRGDPPLAKAFLWSISN